MLTVLQRKLLPGRTGHCRLLGSRALCQFFAIFDGAVVHEEVFGEVFWVPV